MTIALRKTVAVILTLHLFAGLAGNGWAYGCGCAPALDKAAKPAGSCCSALPATDGAQLSALPCCSVPKAPQIPPVSVTAPGSKDMQPTSALPVTFSSNRISPGGSGAGSAVCDNLPPPPRAPIRLMLCSLLI